MDAMAIVGSGMQLDLQRLEIISQNMANVLTPGYKKQIAVGQAFAAHVEDGMGYGAATAPYVLDASAGTLRFTGNLQDIAIDGDGFFEIAGKNGPMYTRRGNFRGDASGRLVGAQDLPAVGVGGEIPLNGSAFSVDRNGDVRQGDHVAGHLKVVRFSNPEALIADGAGLYGQGDAQISTQPATANLRAGYLENSNVSSPQEMVRLTETVRHFEALQKIMQGYDDSMEQAIRKLGEF